MLTKNNIGEIIKVDIIDYSYDALGIGKIENFPIFVSNALIGETVLVKLTIVKKNLAFGEQIEVVKKSSNRVTPKCKYFNLCGGCQLMHMNYEEQLKFKQTILQNNITKIAKINNILVKPTIGMSNPYKYRNKVIQPAAFNIKSYLGMYKAKSHEVIEVFDCLVRDDLINEIFSFISQRLDSLKISIYDEKTYKGILRNVVIKKGFYTNEIMIVFVATSSKNFNVLVDDLINKFNQIKSIYVNINKSKNNNILTEKNILLYGEKYIKDVLMEYNFKIGPLSFYQINTLQTEKLFNLAYKLAAPKIKENALDAYCGIGSIGLPISSKYNKMYGIEIVSESIEIANDIIHENKIDNAIYKVLDSKDINNIMIINDINTVYVDPPRKGLDSKFITELINSKVNKLVYISCNPATLARDINTLVSEGNFTLKEVTPVDMFPQTIHIESVALLER